MYVRHAVRHVRATLEVLVETLLRDYSWMGPVVPFGAKPVTVSRRGPKESDLKQVEGNVVFVSHGGEPDVTEQELGAGYLRAEHVLFVDILGQNESVALAIASDIQDRLRGLLGGTRYVRPREAGTGAELDGYLGEFQDVVRDQPNPDLGAWQSIKATLMLDFPGSNS
jgi:hypothetical protein